MKHIFENLKKYWYFVILILALLVVQAYCDLSLPDYTSNIIDVGIVNGGVEHQMPEFITENSYNSLKLFMNRRQKTGIMLMSLASLTKPISLRTQTKIIWKN